MRFWFARVSRKVGQTLRLGLIPTDEQSVEMLTRLSDGECVEVTISRPRSVQWNKLYWAMCTTIGDNQDPMRDKDSIDAEIRILAGHYDILYFEGRRVYVPKRIAFDRLDGDGWAEFWKKAEVAISERFGSEFLPELP